MIFFFASYKKSVIQLQHPIMGNINGVQEVPDNSVLCFYKGTACHVALPTPAFEMLKVECKNMIEKELRNGVPLKELVDMYFQQLNILEQKYCDYGMSCKEAISNEEAMLYWMDVYSLIMLKKLRDDNNNGFIVITSKK